MRTKIYIKRVNLVLAAISFFIIAGCDTKENSNADRYSQAKVKAIEGVYVFINSEPTTSYEKLGDVKIGLYDKILNLRNKSVSQVSADIITSLSFDRNLNNAIDDVKSKFPQANAVIFNDDMSGCSVIKFDK
jgi:uncharacterized lipoprotein YajG